MEGQLLKQEPSVLSIINTVCLIIISISLMVIADSVSSYSPPETINSIVSAIREFDIITPELQPLQAVEDSEAVNEERVTRDSPCYMDVLYNQGQIQVGYVLEGDTVERTGRVLNGWYEVNLIDSNIKHDSSCWIGP